MGDGMFCSLNKLRINNCVYSSIDGNLESTPITDMKRVVALTTRV